MQFKALPNDAGSKLFVRLNAGESVTGVLRGDPITFEKSFRAGDPPKFRFRVNLIVKENGAFVAKIFEGGTSVYRQLAELSQAGWKLDETWIRIARTGTGMQDTRYTATPSPKPIESVTLRQIESVQLKDLTPQSQKPALQVVGGEPLEPGSDVDERF